MQMGKSLRMLALALAAALGGAARAEEEPLAAAEHEAPAVPGRSRADAVLAELLAGNARFASGQGTQRRVDPAQLRELLGGEHPKAIVVTCSDSRVAPEILFDQALGELHVVRVAGNVAAEAGIASAEYAAERLGVPLLVILGHTECSAVKAALDGYRVGDGNMGCVLSEIEPAARRVRMQPGRESALYRTVKENLGEVATRFVVRSPVLKRLVVQSKLRMVTGVYDLATGKVQIEDGTAGSN